MKRKKKPLKALNMNLGWTPPKNSFLSPSSWYTVVRQLKNPVYLRSLGCATSYACCVAILVRQTSNGFVSSVAKKLPKSKRVSLIV